MIGEGQPSVSFTHIEDDLTVPMPTKDKLEAYIVYVGFDPLSAATRQKKARRRSAPKPSLESLAPNSRRDRSIPAQRDHRRLERAHIGDHHFSRRPPSDASRD